MLIIRSLAIALVIVVIYFSTASTVEARRRGIMIINTGDNVGHVGEVEASQKKMVREVTMADPKVGYYYGRFGILWMNVWTWDGKYCLYDDENNVWDVKPAEAANLMGVAESDLSKPLTYTFPPGLIVIVLLVVGYAVMTMKGKKEEKKVTGLFQDPRYKQALTIFAESSGGDEADDGDEADEQAQQKSADEGFRKAVQYLVGQGIAKEEAEANLGTMIQTMIAAQQD